MLHRALAFLVGVGVILFLSGCVASTIEPDVVMRPIPTPSITPVKATPIPHSSPTYRPTPVAINPPLPKSSPVAVETKLSPSATFVTIIPSEDLKVIAVPCQQLPINNDTPLVGIGHLLVTNWPGSGLKGGITISLKDFTQMPFVESLGEGFFNPILSPNRDVLASHRYGENILNLYDLTTGLISTIPFPNDWVMLQWSLDGRIIASTTGEPPNQTYFVDPITLEVTEKVQPDWLEALYTRPYRAPGTWFVAVDPTETFALYQEHLSFVLRNIKDGNELWRKSNIGGGGPYVWPRWNDQGTQALLILPKTENQAYTLITGLTSDGLEIEIARLVELPGMGNEFTIRYLEWSADERYIHFGLYASRKYYGLGYIFDTVERTLYEICEPDFVEGWWLPSEAGGYLIYLAYKDRDPEVEFSGKRTLTLLDVKTWQRQELLVANIDLDRIHVIGWTAFAIP
ncbi:MAG: hypothetical protein KJ063_25030 [Anaerolineae bacterium]|nr:hypothetical protein [Anaerolineae bacterium]